MNLVAQLDREVKATKGQSISSRALHSLAREMVEQYTGIVRPGLARSGFTDAELEEVDAEMEGALRLATGTKTRKAYMDSGRKVRKSLRELDIARVMRAGAASSQDDAHGQAARTTIDGRILQALDQILPAAAASYEQALMDLDDPGRISYRGVANELREVLREVLDYYAPDDALTAAGVKPHPDHGFTQKQKVRYIMRQRGLPENAREAPERTVEMIEAAMASLARATSIRASISAHVSTGRPEARTVKPYVEVVLADLLNVHAG
jgi:hypothetical protein